MGNGHCIKKDFQFDHSYDSLCYKFSDKDFNENSFILNKTCSKPLTGRQITLYTNDTSNILLSEIKVFGRSLSGKIRDFMTNINHFTTF